MTNVELYQLMGEDSLRFLNNYCTADLQKWDRDSPIEAMLLDTKGRTIALVTVYAVSGGLNLISWGKPTVEVVQHLDRYIFRNDKSIRQLPSLISVNRIESIGDGWLPDGPMVTSVENTQDGWLVNTIVGVSLLLKETAAEVEAQGSSSSDDEEFEARRIRSAFPLVGVDTVEATLPQELGRDVWDISFTKGCYLGQETVARLDARGHVNWKMGRLNLELSDVPELAPGATLYAEDQQVGTITSASGAFGLARLRSSHSAAGTCLRVQTEAGEVLGSATVAAGPQ